jgi:acetyltransferase-like isoleucine patch superfamily enzyme
MPNDKKVSMKFEQLNLNVDEGNYLEIDPECSFTSSKIIIQGQGNRVVLGKAHAYNRMIINLKGNNKTIIVSESVKIISGLKITSIRADNQKVLIGKNFSCGGMEIQMNDGDEVVEIGDNCLFSWGIKIRTSDGHSVVDIGTNRAVNLPKDVTISERVWVGEDVKFLKGARIPKDVVVGSGAIVTKPFTDEDSNTVIGGFPAKVLKRDVRWDRRQPSEFNMKETAVEGDS